MRSIVDRVPKGLPQRMHSNGSSSFSTSARTASSRKLRRGFSVMTFSGQVLRQSPHWMQASSWKRSCGLSGLSCIAPVGHAPTQARQSVQPAASTTTAPKGAPCGSAISSTGSGAALCRWPSASRVTARLPPIGR